MAEWLEWQRHLRAHRPLDRGLPERTVPDGDWGRVARTALVASAAPVLLTAVAPTIAVNPGGADVSLFVPNPLALFPDAAFWAPFRSPI